jgi:hypothetical protein
MWHSRPRLSLERSSTGFAANSNLVTRRPAALLPYSGQELHPPTTPMQKKIFWTTFALLGLLGDIVLPFWWACAATIPILFAAWWFAYRSDWF